MKTEPAPAPSTILGDAAPVTGSSVLTLLTGPRGAGKTRWCLDLFHEARAADIDVTGLICPPVFDGGRKTGIDILDLHTHRRRHLAVYARADGRNAQELGWKFDEAVIAWGNKILRRIGSGDLLILDEMGPLEFENEAGLTEGFAVIAGRRYRQAVVVVRPELLPQALARWPWAERCFRCDGTGS